MLRRIRQLDGQIALGLGVMAAAAVLVIVGAAGLIFALTDDGAGLPSEGSITEIVGEDTAAPTDPAVDATEVPPGPQPTRMLIPRLYLDAPVIVKGLGADRQPEVPDRPDQVAWYPSFSATPGRSSNAVFAGHVDWQTDDGMPIPGVFYRLREMKIGDVIEITLEDGTTLRYRVRANVATAYDDPQIGQILQPTSKDVITIVTCGGSWVKSSRAPNGGNYSHRVIVRAERV